MVGEMALLEHKPRNATVVAETPDEAASCSTPTHFKQLLEEMPKAHDRVMETLVVAEARACAPQPDPASARAMSSAAQRAGSTDTDGAELGVQAAAHPTCGGQQQLGHGVGVGRRAPGPRARSA